MKENWLDHSARDAAGKNLSSLFKGAFVRRAAWLALAVLAILMLGAGIANGGMNDVFVKAVKICTECVGLG